MAVTNGISVWLVENYAMQDIKLPGENM